MLPRGWAPPAHGDMARGAAESSASPVAAMGASGASLAARALEEEGPEASPLKMSDACLPCEHPSLMSPTAHGNRHVAAAAHTPPLDCPLCGHAVAQGRQSLVTHMLRTCPMLARPSPLHAGAAAAVSPASASSESLSEGLSLLKEHVAKLSVTQRINVAESFLRLSKAAAAAADHTRASPHAPLTSKQELADGYLLALVYGNVSESVRPLQLLEPFSHHASVSTPSRSRQAAASEEAEGRSPERAPLAQPSPRDNVPPARQLPRTRLAHALPSAPTAAALTAGPFIAAAAAAAAAAATADAVDDAALHMSSSQSLTSSTPSPSSLRVVPPAEDAMAPPAKRSKLSVDVSPKLVAASAVFTSEEDRRFWSEELPHISLAAQPQHELQEQQQQPQQQQQPPPPSPLAPPESRPASDESPRKAPREPPARRPALSELTPSERNKLTPATRRRARRAADVASPRPDERLKGEDDTLTAS